jgi:hypothetical protein
MRIEKLKAEIKGITDPRREWGNKRHKQEDILIIGLCSVISSGEDFVDMEEFGRDRENWLRGFLELPNGIPDSDTFRRVFERINSIALAKSLHAWLDKTGECGGRSVNIDGKTICGSKSTEHKAYHVVSAWVSENSVTLGELAVDEKSNEITAIPQLLELIEIEGDIVTIDAIGCQTDIATKIRERKADYVLALRTCIHKKQTVLSYGNERKQEARAVVPERPNRCAMGRNTASIFGDAGIHVVKTRVDGCSFVLCKDGMRVASFAA